MLEAITLKNFKSFADATLPLGGLTLLIGTNASGKSNIRDGLRFLHGISRGYTLAEIIGEKWVEGGVLQWKGIRGGLREACRRNGGEARQFTIEARSRIHDGRTATYSITVDVGGAGKVATVSAESLVLSRGGQYVFHTAPEGDELPANKPHQVHARMRKVAKKGFKGPALEFRNDRPILNQVIEHPETQRLTVREDCKAFLDTVASFRFLDLEPESLRRPSIPGQNILSDKGENLSSVLAGICEDAAQKEALIEWTKELTPLDVVDIKFPEVSLGGNIQLQLVEAGGKEISADSASDGTLRFLAYVAALLGKEPAALYFFEEFENGIHPNRLHLLVNLMVQRSRAASIQIAGTTHSPAMLDFLDEKTLESAALIYRGKDGSKIRSFRDIPELWRALGSRKAGGLHAAGWFENVMSFCESAGGT